MISSSLTFRFLLPFVSASANWKNTGQQEDVYFYFDSSERLENAAKDYVDESVLTQDKENG
ncbi:hypothetical protein [uncultured Holdemania sp.]|uniref:hypothetical protein n=1 Tax=uncultured Holdemania sp. TaxID=527664 RepID=UPI0028047D88|nr:hypothetical protein [uncultured Holdemania sp.]